jgi:serine-type D-Ala-D-Ala endopeptidase (penicillin-binding protein 7)
MVDYRKLIILFGLLISSYSYALDLPQFTAKSWLVADGNGQILQGEHTTDVRSIASISKLMTVMVVLDQHQDLNERIGPYTRHELINLALVKSDNTAARLLCDHYPTGNIGCVRDMNIKARYLKLANTNFIEPTGLSVMNVSTAEELIKLVQAASEYPEITAAAQISEIKIKIRKKWLVFHNTNPIIGKRYKFIVSKTGFINASGGCIVMMLDTDIGRRIVVILGSKNTKTRIPEAEFIAQNYTN